MLIIPKQQRIDFTYKFSKDLSKINEVFNFLVPYKESTTLAAVAWIGKNHQKLDILLRLLKHIQKLLTSRLPSYDFWLLVGTSAWQLNNRITCHRGLSGILKSQGAGILVPEHKIKSSMLFSKALLMMPNIPLLPFQILP